MEQDKRIADPYPYPHPAGGWGSLKAVATILVEERAPLRTARALAVQNKSPGFTCVSCAWAKPSDPHPAEFCENGAKATAWELTSRKLEAPFFEAHTLAELAQWPDHELEAAGRLTVPLRWNGSTDKYEAIGWDEAFAGIGEHLRRLRDADRRSVVFYASGRASLETSYLYQLLARLFGNNNLPDSSNMCHESTSVALPESIGVPVGTVKLEDFAQTEAIFFFGQNVGVNSPRMLHDLQDARKRDVPIVTFNPLRETGLVHFANPQSPVEMLTPAQTQVSTQYLQVKNGGDMAALTGLCKAILALDDDARAKGVAGPVDHAFIAQHTSGFDAFAVYLRAQDWAEIEDVSGLPKTSLEAAAATYAAARSVICVYGMGLTQHRNGVQNVQMVANLLLLGGHIGRPGAGICPVRGHSNVQGQRTVGITEKPELAPLDKLAELYGFEPPREKGLNTVEACQAILSGELRGFVSLGGNFLRAAPETRLLEAAWRELPLTVQIATKLNRSHVVHGKAAYLLPCLGRIEIDRQSSGEQAVSTEDSTGVIHVSQGVAEPAAPSLLSEAAIIAGIAQASLPPNPKVPWTEWVADYASIRDAIARTLPEAFHDYNQRLSQERRFDRPLPARERVWKTKTGKANFLGYGDLHANDPEVRQHGVLSLLTMRSDDQFNTTIYSLDDRFRGIHGTRRVLMLNPADMEELGVREGDQVNVIGAIDDGERRCVDGLAVVAYDIPRGCAAGYYPECNPLIPVTHHAEKSFVPAAKSIPIRISRVGQ